MRSDSCRSQQNSEFTEFDAHRSLAAYTRFMFEDLLLSSNTLPSHIKYDIVLSVHWRYYARSSNSVPPCVGAGGGAMTFSGG